MLWFRVDNRLVHGQVIEAWLPHIRAKTLLVADSDLAADELRQEIMSLAVPSDVSFVCCPVGEAANVLRRVYDENPDQNVLILFSSCSDAKAAHMSGLSFSLINIGNLHYGPGKEQICEHIALGSDDRECLDYFAKHGVDIDFRCVPTAMTKVNL